MKDISIGETVYKVTGTSKIIGYSNYSVSSLEDTFYLVDLYLKNKKKGSILVGKIKAIVDSLVYSKKHGAIGDPTEFRGNNLTIIGLLSDDLKGNFDVTEITTPDIVTHVQSEAEKMIIKVKDKVFSHNSKIEFDDKDDDCKYIIIGRRNFLLVGSENKFVLVTKQQIAVRDGESKLVRISPDSGIEIASHDKLFNIGRGNPGSLESTLGGLGVKIASSILDEVIWD